MAVSTRSPQAQQADKARIFEIFTSIEGEGILYGTKTLFVRFAGCPFGCFYCDTTSALPASSGTEYSLNEAKDLVLQNLHDNTYKVNFTGGEPLMQPAALRELASCVKSKGVSTYLESSCFDFKRFNKVVENIDYVKIEFKTPESDFVDKEHFPLLVENAFDCLKRSVELGKTTYIKIVVSSKTLPAVLKQTFLERMFDYADSKGISGFIIQPSTGVCEPSLDQLLEFYDTVYPYYSEVRIIPQLHKLIGAR